jgi:hypothetical protein
MRVLPELWLGLVILLVALASPFALGQEADPGGASRGGGASGSRDPATRLADLHLLAPGTRVDTGPPTGWTHLILKSVPRLASGDLDTLPGMANSTATMFRTVILADVRPVGSGPDRRFVLRRIGLGMCVPVQGHDTVVMRDSVAAQGIELGMVGRTVLDRAEQELRRGRIVARTPTFALFSAPAMMRVGTIHREVLLRYAFLVDPATGALQTVVWAIAPEPGQRNAARTIVLLAPSLIYDCGLDVLAYRLLGALPVNWSFAMRSLPTGQPRTVTPNLQAWTVRDVRTPAEAEQLEDALRVSLNETDRHAAR